MHSISRLSLFISLFSVTGIVHAQTKAKFAVNKSGMIYVTDAGEDFVDKVARKQVAGTLRKISEDEAHDWMEKFVKLSDKDAQKSPNFTPVNNLLNHMLLCDSVLASLILKSGATAPTIKDSDKLTARGKKRVAAELENLDKKLNNDIETLVAPSDRKSFRIITDYYRRALNETLELP